MRLLTIGIICCALSIHCTNPESNFGSEKQTADIMIDERDLVPEGLALDERDGTIYLSSMWKRKVVRINGNGLVSDFVPAASDGLWSTIGMEVDEDRDQLWVVSSQYHEVAPLQNPDSFQRRSQVYCFDLKTSKLIKKYSVPIQAYS